MDKRYSDFLKLYQETEKVRGLMCGVWCGGGIGVGSLCLFVNMGVWWGGGGGGVLSAHPSNSNPFRLFRSSPPSPCPLSGRSLQQQARSRLSLPQENLLRLQQTRSIRPKKRKKNILRAHARHPQLRERGASYCSHRTFPRLLNARKY